MYLDLAAQGFTPYHKYRTVEGDVGAPGAPGGGLKPVSALSEPERAAKIQLWVAHLHHASNGECVRKAGDGQTIQNT